jgi:hypothetical protein
MSTQYEIFATIKSAMADNDEVVEFCEKQMAALDRKREQARGHKRVYKPSSATLAIRAAVLDYLKSLDENVIATNKEIAAALTVDFATEGVDLEVTSQGVAAALRYFVSQGLVERIPAKTKTGAVMFCAVTE